MFKNRIISGSLLIIFVVVSYLVLIQYVTPLIVEATNSDLFIEDTGDYRIEGPSSTSMTETASTICFNELIAQHDEMADIDISKLKHTAWSLGGYHYIVNATIPAAQSSDNTSRIMACEVTYDHTTETPDNEDSWTVTGLSYSTPDN